MEAFLASFEQMAEAQCWSKEEWVAQLLPTLGGERKHLLSSLEVSDRQDYEKVKAALLQGNAAYSLPRQQLLQFQESQENTSVSQERAGARQETHPVVDANMPVFFGKRLNLPGKSILKEIDTEQLLVPKPDHLVSFLEEGDGPVASFFKEEDERLAGEKQFKCSVCGKWYRSKYGLSRHLRIHAGDPSFQCSVCGKTFFHKRNLTQHKRIHTEEKPYGCPLCERRYISKTGLRLHQRTHTGEKPYQCSDCEKRFHFESNLQQHQRRIHLEVKPHGPLKGEKSSSQQ
ncbi:zinc finger protein ZFP2-like isoform X2 [Hemicordylus capensis]|uniref:zinc finger protein ZFP2-like isoform X2 n=1 Tax=Hemicordylus capensis TaxID=884348 RepID=UPI0023036298|nr:zinc finger protein ZFP2-like isoform X2 [Hemicordylus capensis]